MEKTKFESMGIDQLRPKLGPQINRAAIGGVRTLILRNGTPYAFLIGFDDEGADAIRREYDETIAAETSRAA